MLGSGEFVSATLQQSERDLVKKYLLQRPMEEILALVAKRFGLEPELIQSLHRSSHGEL